MTWTSVEFQAEALAMCRTDWNREHRGSAESRNGSPSCDESGKGDGLWNGFPAHCVIVWKTVRVGNKKHLKLKKKKKKNSRGKVEGSQKIETNLSIYINPTLRAPGLPASSINVWGSRAPYGKLLFRLGDVEFSLQRELVKETIRVAMERTWGPNPANKKVMLM